MKVVMGLNNGLHNVPVRIEPGQSSLAPPPFNSNNNNNNLKGHTSMTRDLPHDIKKS